MSTKMLRTGDILKEYGYVTEEQIGDAIAYQKAHRGVRIGDALIALGYIDEIHLLQALGQRLHLKIIDLNNESVDVTAVEKIPRPLAEKYEMLAISINNGVLRLALNDPMNFYGIEDIRQVTGMQVESCLCQRSALQQAIQYYYTEVDAKKAV